MEHGCGGSVQRDRLPRDDARRSARYLTGLDQRPVGATEGALDRLAAAWGQNAGMASVCPINATLEEVSRWWLLELLGLPPRSGAAFVTGGTMANVSALAAARHHQLARVGWDVDADGLFGALPVREFLPRI